MGAQESKRWTELTPETPQAQNPKVSDLKSEEDPRSPNYRYQRTPIRLQDFQDSPQNLELHSQSSFDPRSPTVLIERTPLSLRKSRRESNSDEQDEVFETRARSNSEPSSPVSKAKGDEVTLSPEAPITRKDRKSLLKKTSSPGDFRRKKRVSRRQSVPQKLFSESSSKVVPVTRSPLVQRNFSEGSDLCYNAKSKKFTFVPKKSGFIYEDLCSGKENHSATNPLAVA